MEAEPHALHAQAKVAPSMLRCNRMLHLGLGRNNKGGSESGVYKNKFIYEGQSHQFCYEAFKSTRQHRFTVTVYGLIWPGIDVRSKSAP